MNSDMTAKQRLAIVRAAEKAYTRSGIKQITMDNISSIVGISKRTLYEVFKNKEELVYEVLRYQYDESVAKSIKIASTADNALDSIYGFYKFRMAKLKNTNPKFLVELERYPMAIRRFQKYRDANATETARFYQRGVDEGLFREDLNFHLMEIMFRCQMRNIIFAPELKSYKPAEVFQTVVFSFMRGICTKKGYEIIEGYRW